MLSILLDSFDQFVTMCSYEVHSPECVEGKSSEVRYPQTTFVQRHQVVHVLGATLSGRDLGGRTWANQSTPTGPRSLPSAEGKDPTSCLSRGSATPPKRGRHSSRGSRTATSSPPSTTAVWDVRRCPRAISRRSRWPTTPQLCC